MVSILSETQFKMSVYYYKFSILQKIDAHLIRSRKLWMLYRLLVRFVELDPPHRLLTLQTLEHKLKSTRRFTRNKEYILKKLS